MSATFVGAWAGSGVVVGAALAMICGRLLRTEPASLPRVTWLAAPVLTGLTFAGLAWRLGHQFDLLPYSVLAAVGVALSLTDVIEQRLPSVLVYTGTGAIGGLLVTSAALQDKGPDLLRALAGMALLATFYLVLALASNGGLGAGDVKLGGLLGLSLAWQGWSMLITATFLGWLTAALAWIALRTARRRSHNDHLPMGPFLLASALISIIVFLE